MPSHNRSGLRALRQTPKHTAVEMYYITFSLCFSAGLLGPTLRAEEGETIVVTFRNLASGTYSIHPHGVAYGKQSEGECLLTQLVDCSNTNICQYTKQLCLSCSKILTRTRRSSKQAVLKSNRKYYKSFGMYCICIYSKDSL